MSRYITPKVPMMDMGSARLGMVVAEIFRKKMKITKTTRARVSHKVNFTSLMESRIDIERS